MIPSKFMPDMLFSPGHHYSHHGIVKFINMLKYDLNPAELNNQTLVAIFHRMFGGNPAFIKRLLMALSMGLGKYDSTWHWRIYHIRQIVPPEKAASQSNADQLRGLNDLGINQIIPTNNVGRDFFMLPDKRKDRTYPRSVLYIPPKYPFRFKQ